MTQTIMRGGVAIQVPDTDPDAQPVAVALSVDQQKADLVTYAAAARYARETSGVTVNGAPIATDRDSQNLISGAYSYVLAKPDATIAFKSTSGFVTLTADQIQAIALAVGGHVQACFAAEAQINSDIAAGKTTTTAQVDTAFTAAGV